MNMSRARLALLLALACVTFLLAQNIPVRAVTLTISTDQPIYPVWGLGGEVTVTAQNLLPNVTYYLWLEKPRETSSNFTGSSFPHVNVGVPSQAILKLALSDPPGTYLLSLSTSATTDTFETMTHFGVLGTNSQSYERTQTVEIAGGGFAANSTILLAIGSAKGAIPGFPVNITAHGDGDFEYSFRLPASADLGRLNATITGDTYDTRQPETTRSFFTVTPSTITVQPLTPPASEVQRTMPVDTTYRLTYQDGSAVTAANATAELVLPNQTVYTLPLSLVNSSSGEWRASWTPPPSSSNATYSFQFYPANFTDAYGNTGQGAPITSASFQVIPAKLQLTIQANQAIQRTQNFTLAISAMYPGGESVSNLTQAMITIIQGNGTVIRIVPLLTSTQVSTSIKIPVNAPIGNWTVNYGVRDHWNNSGSNKFIFHVQHASLAFQTQTPATTQRTTSLNMTNTIYYPDGSTLNSTVTLQVFGVNKTWTPPLTYDPSNGEWSGSVYIVQNATLGQYNITWAAHDAYGNAESMNYSTLIVPARFSFLVQANNATVPAESNLDLPVVVRYPNGSLLTNSFGNATGSYQNSTGYVFTLPLAYNATNGTWHMFFFVPAQSNATLTFTATDNFGNSAIAADAYNLKIAPVPRVITQNLIIAGIVGALVPIGLLAWAFATISTRRRKHKP